MTRNNDDARRFKIMRGASETAILIRQKAIDCKLTDILHIKTIENYYIFIIIYRQENG